VRHHKKKQSSAETEELSALDVLAERRAMEILEANGIELEAPEAVETEKTSASEEEMNLLAQAVEARAEELLAANGYEFEQEQVEEQAQE
jgi:arsenate reductase-like glutaredoxin family protein